jgi:hypothetical protein
MERLLVTGLTLAFVASLSAQTKKDVIQSQQRSIDSLSSIVQQLSEQLADHGSLIAEQKAALQRVQMLSDLKDRSHDSLLHVHADLQQRLGTLGLMFYQELPYNYSIYDNDLVHESCVLHVFSDPAAPDTFRIRIYGDGAAAFISVLEIKDGKGRILFKDTLPSDEDFIFDEEPADPRCSAMLGAVQTLRASAFRSPAIGATEEEQRRFDLGFDIAYAVDAMTWNAIRSDPTAVAFTVNLGWENTQTLVFNKRNGLVVDIHPVHP